MVQSSPVVEIVMHVICDDECLQAASLQHCAKVTLFRRPELMVKQDGRMDVRGPRSLTDLPTVCSLSAILPQNTIHDTTMVRTLDTCVSRHAFFVSNSSVGCILILVGSHIFTITPKRPTPCLVVGFDSLCSVWQTYLIITYILITYNCLYYPPKHFNE